MRILLSALLLLVAFDANAETYKALSVSGQVGVGAESGAAPSQSANGLAEATIGGGFFFDAIGLNPFGEGLYFLKRPLLGATVQAAGAGTIQSCEGCELALGALTADATLHGIYVDGSAGFKYQAPVSMTQRFWRSTQGLEERRLGFHFPGVMSVDADEPDYRIKFRLLGFDTDRTEVLKHVGPETGHVGDDYRWYIYGFAADIDLGDESYHLRGATYEINYWVSPQPHTDARNEPIPLVRDYRDGADRVSSMELTVIDVGRSAPGLGVTRAAFGMTFLTPLNPGVADFHDIAFSWAFGLGQNAFELQRTLWDGDGILKPRHQPFGWNVELGSFHRISPTGLAVDRGQKVRADLGWRISDALYTSASATAIRAERKLVYEPWAFLLDEFGDTLPMIMARLEVNAAWEINEFSTLSASAWTENSDRPNTSSGFNLSLGFNY